MMEERQKMVYSTAELAAYLGVSCQEVRRLADEGILKPLRGFRKPFKFSWYEIHKWMNGGKKLV